LGRGLACFLTILAFLGVFFALPVRAHHIAGLPHYGYTENYPQVPLTEQTEEVGDFSVSLTTVFFQGINQELSNVPYDTQFYVYIFDRTIEGEPHSEGFQNPFDADVKKEASEHELTGPSYRGSLVLTLSDEGDNQVASYRLEAPIEEAVYRFRHYFSRPGDYTVTLEFLQESGGKKVKFPVSIEVAGKGKWVIMAGFAASVIALGLFLYYWRKKKPSPAG
jgi:hypothetical protein